MSPVGTRGRRSEVSGAALDQLADDALDEIERRWPDEVARWVASETAPTEALQRPQQPPGRLDLDAT